MKCFHSKGFKNDCKLCRSEKDMFEDVEIFANYEK